MKVVSDELVIQNDADATVAKFDSSGNMTINWIVDTRTTAVLSGDTLYIDGKSSYITIDTEGSAALDTCKYIIGSTDEGTVIEIETADNARDVMIEIGNAGTGGIYLENTNDWTLDNVRDKLRLRYRNNEWHAVGQYNNGG